MTFRHNKAALGVAWYLGSTLAQAFRDDTYNDARYLIAFGKNYEDVRMFMHVYGFLAWVMCTFAVYYWNLGIGVAVLATPLIWYVTQRLTNYRLQRMRKSHEAKLAERPEYWRELSRKLSKILDDAGLGHFYTNRMQ